MIDYVAIAAAILGLWLFVEVIAFIRRLHREPEPPLLDGPGDMYGHPHLAERLSQDRAIIATYRSMALAAIQEAQARLGDGSEDADACAVTVLAAMLEAGGLEAFTELWPDSARLPHLLACINAQPEDATDDV